MAEYGGQPFAEQIRFLRSKVRLPTRTWRDIRDRQHARAFVVAGAMRDDLIADLQRAVLRGAEEGTTLAQFRQDFDDLVARHGWTGWTGEGTPGGRAWRTRTIYETNLFTSYQAGRYQQMKEVTDTRPYWTYRHSIASEDPREEHLSWDGITLHHTDPWWSTHYPKNGWGCKCYVETKRAEDVPDGPHEAPTAPDDTAGIDEGWDYNVGEAAWGKPVQDRAIERARRGDTEWEPYGGSTWMERGRPERLEPQSAPALLPAATDAKQTVAAVRQAIGGGDRTYRPGGLPAHVDAEALGNHMDPARARYLPLMHDALDAPQEVWVAFERHRETGRMRLRTRVIKEFAHEGGEQPALVVLDASGGTLVGWTFLTTSDRNYLNRQRRGQLMFTEDDSEER